jgi:hypothetical protein
MDPGTRGELVLAEMGEDTPSTNHRARDFRYQHAEKSRLGDVETQGDAFHHRPRRWARMQRPRGGIVPVGQRVARLLPERWPALSLAGVSWRLRLKAINSRTGGQLGCCPFKLGASARPKRTGAGGR